MPRSRRPRTSFPAGLPAGRGWALPMVVSMVLVLLFAQTQASLHWLSHATSAIHQAGRQASQAARAGLEPSSRRAGDVPGSSAAGSERLAADARSAPRGDRAADLSCDKCASLASLSAMLPGDMFELLLQAGRDVQVAVRAWSSAERILRLGYLSRAPPTGG